MFGISLFVLIGSGLAAFMVNRLYVGVGGRQINAKGATLIAILHPCHVLDRDGHGRIRTVLRSANRLGWHHVALQ